MNRFYYYYYKQGHHFFKKSLVIIILLAEHKIVMFFFIFLLFFFFNLTNTLIIYQTFVRQVSKFYFITSAISKITDLLLQKQKCHKSATINYSDTCRSVASKHHSAGSWLLSDLKEDSAPWVLIRSYHSLSRLRHSKILIAVSSVKSDAAFGGALVKLSFPKLAACQGVSCCLCQLLWTLLVKVLLVRL